MVEVPLAHHGSDAGLLPSQRIVDRRRHVLESIGDAFYTLDRDWCFGYVNGVAERMWARRRDGLLGRDIRLAFPQLIGSDLASAIDAALTEGNSIQLETIDPVLCAPIELNIVANPAGAAIYFRAVTCTDTCPKPAASTTKCSPWQRNPAELASGSSIARPECCWAPHNSIASWDLPRPPLLCPSKPPGGCAIPKTRTASTSYSITRSRAGRTIWRPRTPSSDQTD